MTILQHHDFVVYNAPGRNMPAQGTIVGIDARAVRIERTDGSVDTVNPKLAKVTLLVRPATKR